MGNALNGLLLLVCGATLYAVISHWGAMAAMSVWSAPPEWALLAAVGLVVMIGGPVVYWIVVPIRNRRKSRKSSW